jgi:hypothetical protein
MLGTVLAHSTTTSPATSIQQTSPTLPCKPYPFPPSLDQSRQPHQIESQKPRPGSLLLAYLVEAGIVGAMPFIRLARSATTPTEPASMQSPDETARSLQEATFTRIPPANRDAWNREGKKCKKCSLPQLSNFKAISTLIMNHIQCPLSADQAPASRMHRLDRKDTRRC